MSESADEIRRKLLKPAINESFNLITDILTATYSLPPFTVVKKLDSYDDENFLINVPSTNTNYLCKVHNGVESDVSGIIDYQNSIMLHLNATTGITTTNPLPTNTKDLSSKHSLPVQSTEHSPYPLTVRLLTYIEGTPMAYKSVTPALLNSAGQYLANIDKSLDTFSHPNADRFHIWCQENTAELTPFLQYIQTDSRRALVKSVLDRFTTDVLPAASEFRKGILQSDFNDANIIIGNNDKIAGVIDFGDSVRRYVHNAQIHPCASSMLVFTKFLGRTRCRRPM